MGYTPNYLGFLQAAPKTSPLERAISGALGTYGDVQKLRQQTAITENLPKQLKAERELQEAKVGEEQARAQYLPTQLKQEEQQRSADLQLKQLLVKAAPADIRAHLTGEHLTNILNEQKAQVGAMGLEQSKESYINSKIAELYQETLKGMGGTDDENAPAPLPDEVAAKQYQNILSKGKKLNYDMSGLPQRWEDAKPYAAALYAHTPDNINIKKFQVAMHEKYLLGRAALDAKGAKDDPVYTAKQIEQNKYDEKYVNEEIPNEAKTAVSSMPMAEDLLRIINQHPDQFGAVVGDVYKSWSTENQKAIFDSSHFIAATMSQMPASALRSFASALKYVQTLKPDPTKNTLGSLRYATQVVHAMMVSELEKQKFINFMADNYGIINKRELEGSWNKFVQSNPYMDKNGHIDPRGLANWSQWFSQNPEAAPHSLRIKRDIQGMMNNAAQVNAQRAPGGQAQQNNTTAATQNAVSTGVISPWLKNSFSGSNTLTSILGGYD